MRRASFAICAMALWTVSSVQAASPPTDTEVWKQFVTVLTNGPFPPEKTRPHHESFREPFLGFLDLFREKVPPEAWKAVPELRRVDDHLHGLIPLTLDGERATYCFTFLVEKDDWYLRHMETISIRLDKVETLPASSFPDVTENQKAWIREETYWTEQIRLFNLLVEEKGKDFAFHWFRAGAGYALAAKTWVPFVPPARAFILYLCWEQANLRGNPVTLEALTPDRARVTIEPVFFQLYERTAHFKTRIAFDDYRRIFETIWQDRACEAGWTLRIEYGGDACIFHFTKGHGDKPQTVRHAKPS